MAKKKQAKGGKKEEFTGNSTSSSVIVSPLLDKKDEVVKISSRAVAGVLSSHPLSRDIKITNFSLGLHGTELITDAEMEFSYGNRYGLLGLNGTGKSTLLNAIAEREVPIPSHTTIFHLDKEVEASDKSALESVISEIEAENERLEALVDEIMEKEGPDSENLEFVYDCIEELDMDNATRRAGEILHGLGFTKEMQAKKTKDFSGGWRMRIALARALFVKPGMLLLDEPTNHLDLEACVWLEEYLKKYNRILLIVSHSQDFLNGVCTHIIHLSGKKLTYYSGNYDTYVKTRAEKEENQMKQYNWEQDQISHMKDYIARFGHGSAKLARQAKSKEKTLSKMEAGGLTEKVLTDKVIKINFPSCGTLPPPVLQFNKVSFAYSNKKEDVLYSDLDFGIDLDSRIALVGPNGAGKSTLLKLIADALTPTEGIVRRHSHLKVAWYHQHLTDQLDLEVSPLQYMLQCFPNIKEEEVMRKAIGRFGITGKNQMTPIRNLSDGLKSRVIFSWLAFNEPHLLLLDEPTNHLDIETIDALAKGINEFEGGLVLVSHDFRLIGQVAKEIWICDKKKITKWDKDIIAYKNHIAQQSRSSH